MKHKKQLIIGQIILAVCAIVATLIMLRPGSSFNISENWFLFLIIIILPTIYGTIAIASAKNKDDKKDDE